MAVSVVVAVGDVGDPLIDAIRLRLDKLVVGPGDDAASEMGPLIAAEHRDRVASYLDKGAAAGAVTVVDGRATGLKETLGRCDHDACRKTIDLATVHLDVLEVLVDRLRGDRRP